ncbi:hypothetical protein QR680_010543 [Steinernema hermaphroditum]|uniref:Uncharacterized protein n=1 Tax=Steinernema hermaphroditum TaxID=289476 RepID=A0AA39MBX2_9BILA|nr:hypothetical protein QR680_010543 [Steinernema hermaphroditum]
MLPKGAPYDRKAYDNNIGSITPWMTVKMAKYITTDGEDAYPNATADIKMAVNYIENAAKYKLSDRAGVLDAGRRFHTYLLLDPTRLPEGFDPEKIGFSDFLRAVFYIGKATGDRYSAEDAALVYEDAMMECFPEGFLVNDKKGHGNLAAILDSYGKQAHSQKLSPLRSMKEIKVKIGAYLLCKKWQIFQLEKSNEISASNVQLLKAVQ